MLSTLVLSTGCGALHMYHVACLLKHSAAAELANQCSQPVLSATHHFCEALHCIVTTR